MLRQFKVQSDAKIWVVYANHSLAPLLDKMVQEAWQDAPAGELKKKVEYWHIKLLIDQLLDLSGIRFNYELNYDAAAQRLLQKSSAWEGIGLGCDAMFVDEGQDLGPNTFRLLNKLIRQRGTDDGLSISIFYDNAQNIYGRSTPKWKELGIDMQGRSTIMKESFRSTRPVTEFALNVLYQLQPPVDEDHKELVRLGLIESERWGESNWWNVHFNQVDGPNPTFRPYPTVKEEVTAIARQIVVWIKDEGVMPSDICILYVKTGGIEQEIETTVASALKPVGANLAIQRGERFVEDARTVLATTPHSFKGYDREVVIIAGVDAFADPDRARTLYVAMTRARSLLAVYGREGRRAEVQSLFAILRRCLARLSTPPLVESVDAPAEAGSPQ